MREGLFEITSDPAWWLTTVVVAGIIGIVVNFISTYAVNPWWSRRAKQTKERLEYYRKLADDVRAGLNNQATIAELSIGLQVIALVRMEAQLRITVALFVAILAGSLGVAFGPPPLPWYVIALIIPAMSLFVIMLFAGHADHMRCLQAEEALFEVLKTPR